MPFYADFILGLWSIGATLVVCVFARALGRRAGLLDEPGDRKLHHRPTPLVGGIALLVGFVPAVTLAAGTGTLAFKSMEIVTIALCTAAIAATGIADDRHNLTPSHRLVLSFLIYGLAAAFFDSLNVRLLDFEHPAVSIGLATFPMSLFFTTLCLVGLANAVNMADGKNGLVLGICLGWTILITLRAPDWLSPVLISLSGVLAVLLAFNLRGRLFLGDGGAYGLAAAIGLMAIATYNHPGDHARRAISAEELMVLFAVPVLDSFRLTYVRLRRGQSPMAPDRDHLHHHLERRFGWPRGLLIYWAMALIPATIVFVLF